MTFRAPHRNPPFYISIVCVVLLAGAILNQLQPRAEATASPSSIEPLTLDVVGSAMAPPTAPEALIGSSASGWTRLVATPTPVPKASLWPDWVRVSRPDLLVPLTDDGSTTRVRLLEGTPLKVLDCAGQRCRVVFGGDSEDDPAEGWVAEASLSPATAPKWAMTWRGTHLNTGPSAAPEGGIWLPSRAVVEVVEDVGDRLKVFYLGDGRTREAATGLVAEADLVPAGALMSAEDGGVRILTQAQLTSIQAGEGVWLQVPHRSQLDGTPAAEANCGPASVGMVLEQLGRQLLTQDLREIAHRYQGTNGPDVGFRIEHLRSVVEAEGGQGLGLYQGSAFRQWTLDDIRAHLEQGHPVIPQLKFKMLPGRYTAGYADDHYVVITGMLGDDFVYNDSVDNDGPGYARLMSADTLTKAWSSSLYPFAAFAVANR